MIYQMTFGLIQNVIWVDPKCVVAMRLLDKEHDYLNNTNYMMAVDVMYGDNNRTYFIELSSDETLAKTRFDLKVAEIIYQQMRS